MKQRRPGLTKTLHRIRKVNEALVTNDIEALRLLARTEDGFVSDGLRRLAWPILLGCTEHIEPSLPSELHRDEDQVKLDVDRSFVTYPRGISPSEKKSRQAELLNLITYVLRRNPPLSYYQGYHDVCSIFLLVLGAKKAAQLCEKISTIFIRDAMMDTMSPILWQLELIPKIIAKRNPSLARLLSPLQEHYYALSWILTWFSHDLYEQNDITRLFDLFVASNPIMPVYVAAALVLYHADTIRDLPSDLRTDSAILHTTISKLPMQSFPVGEIISQASELYEAYPPEKPPVSASKSLAKWSAVNTWNANAPGGGNVDVAQLEKYRKAAQKDEAIYKAGGRKTAEKIRGQLSRRDVEVGVAVGVISIASAAAVYIYSVYSWA